MRLSILFATVLTIGLIAAAPASAGTVCSIAGTATFLAADVASGCPTGVNNSSEVNVLSVSADASGNVVFTDLTQNPIVDGDGAGGCTVSGSSGTCPGG